MTSINAIQESYHIRGHCLLCAEIYLFIFCLHVNSDRFCHLESVINCKDINIQEIHQKSSRYYDNSKPTKVGIMQTVTFLGQSMEMNYGF